MTATSRNSSSIVLTIFGLAIAGALIAAAIATPNLLRSRIAANEASAVGSLRAISIAAETYKSQHPGEGYPQRLADLAPYLDHTLTAGERSGYRFAYQPQGSGGFQITAAPAVEGKTGQRSFSTTESRAITYRASALAEEKTLDGGEPAAPNEQSATEPQRRMIQRASLALIVADADAAVDRIRAVANRLGGYVESVRVTGEDAGTRQGLVAIRVPATRLDQARREVRGFAQRVRSDEADARDVSSQYVDLESTLRNYRAEEAQYLEIMRRAGSIKDTLAVAERLADVRGRIERIQGQLNLMSRQTEMALLEVTLGTEAVIKPVDVRWHPAAEIAAAFSDTLSDLSTFANFLIAVAFRLPVFALWALTTVLFATYGWRLLRWTWKKVSPRAVTA